MNMKKLLFTILLVSLSISGFAKIEVNIQGDGFYINGRPTYEGRYWKGNKVEGLLMNARLVQGVFDDITNSKEAAERFAYPDKKVWDAQRNTTEFIAAMEQWHSYGLLAFTLNLQGGSPMGYGGNVGFVNSAFNKNGAFRADYKARVKQILDRADELGMVVILGCFYQGQDQYLEEKKAIYRAVKETVEWILENDYRNVMIEINNESDVKSYDHEILKSTNVHKLIAYAQNITRDGRRLFVSTSLKGCSVPTEEIVAVADYILIHGNGMGRPEQMRKCVQSTRALSTYTAKPIVVNEDDNYKFDSEFNNLAVATEEYASWGYFDYRRKDEPFTDGFQSIPADWGINSKRKKAFFNAVKEITNFSAAPETFKNPILPGYHPDPSICRKGDDYYLVNSSFEWYPSVPIYHSKDLVNWELIGYAGSQENNFKLPEKAKDSGGIYAATIHYHDGLFYMITTNTEWKWNNSNFYVTAKDPAGPWSEPIYLDSPGIDPSLFWDDDGKCYYIGQGNLLPKPEWEVQHGVWLQELDLKQGKLVGERKQLTFGHSAIARAAEGPHLHKIGNKYVVMLAEGGTYRGHAMTIFESTNLWGPYTANVCNPIISHRHLGPRHPVSSIGHADMIQTQHGDWWMVTLGRRHFHNGLTYLARETFLTPVTIYEKATYGEVAIVVNEGEGKMPVVAKRPRLDWTPHEIAPIRDDFNGDKLDLEWNMLRTPTSKWYTINNSELTLELRPETTDEFTNPSLLAKRISHHTFRASTRMNFKTKNDNEAAGLVLYRVTSGQLTFMKTKNALVITSVIQGEKKEVCKVECNKDEIILAMVSDGKDVRFEWGEPDQAFHKLDVTVPLALISDDYNGGGGKGYNGAMIGMYATSHGKPSRNKVAFAWFDYANR